MPRAVASKITPKYVISLYYAGCVNRPFYPLVVFPHRNPPHKVHNYEGTVIEQIGAFDPLPNKRNEKVAAINFERLSYWLAKDAILTRAAAELIGLSGYLPIHPHTFYRAKRARDAKPIFVKKSDTDTTDESTVTDSEPTVTETETTLQQQQQASS